MTLNKHCIRFWLQVMKMKKRFISGTEDTGNTHGMFKCKCCLLDLHKNKTIIRFVPSSKQEIRSDRREQNMSSQIWVTLEKAATHPEREFPVISDSWIKTHRRGDKLPRKAPERAASALCDVIKQHFLEQTH